MADNNVSDRTSSVSLKTFLKSPEAKRKTKKPVMIYLNEETYRSVLEIVKANGISFNHFVENFCKLFLEDKIQIKPEYLQSFLK